jgi:transposase
MHRLLDEGLSKVEVARRLGRSRQTIYNWLAEGKDPRPKAARASKLDPYKPFLDSRLQEYDLPATGLLKEIREQGYTGQITILREYVAQVKAREVRRVVDRFETEPGRQAQVDWASCGTIWHRGRRRRLSLLVVTLGYSRTIWARFVVSERRHVLLELLEQAFRELGGGPRELLVDNMKQAIDLALTPDRAAVVNGEFQRFADHWGFEVVACPPYWPRAKGKVERAILYLKRSFLEGREFEDLDELNAQLQRWLAETANVRRHGTTQQRPVDRLAADQQGMRPLATPYPAAERARRRADHDGFLSYRGVRYSVDPAILRRRRGEPVEIQLGTDERLRIFHRDRLVGEHAVVPKGSPPQDDPLHAAARRRLRQRPSGRPRGKTPRFAQIPRDLDLDAVLAHAPVVVQRPLVAYEGGA